MTLRFLPSPGPRPAALVVAALLTALGVGCAPPAPRSTTPLAASHAHATRPDAAALAPVAAAVTLVHPGEVDLAAPPLRRPRPNAELLAATKRRFRGDCIRAWNAEERDVSIELGPRGRVLPTPDGAYVRLYARW